MGHDKYSILNVPLLIVKYMQRWCQDVNESVPRARERAYEVTRNTSIQEKCTQQVMNTRAPTKAPMVPPIGMPRGDGIVDMEVSADRTCT